MIIRKAQEPDMAAIVSFQKQMAMETEQISLDSESLEMGVRQLFSDPTKGRYYVAIEDNEVVGCLMTTFEWSDWRNGTVIWIQSVFVHKDFRGRGVYKEMYEHIRSMVNSDKQLKGIRLYVDDSNKSAQTVYSKLGMNGEHYRVFEWMK